MKNETQCSICGDIISLDDAKYIKNAPVCVSCQHIIVMADVDREDQAFIEE